MLVDTQEGEFRAAILAGQNCVNAVRVRSRVYHVVLLAADCVQCSYMYIVNCISFDEPIAKIRLKNMLKYNNVKDVYN